MKHLGPHPRPPELDCSFTESPGFLHALCNALFCTSERQAVDDVKGKRSRADSWIGISSQIFTDLS